MALTEKLPTALEPSLAERRESKTRRNRLWRILIAVVVTLGLAAFVTWQAYGRVYSPLGPGSYGGVGTPDSVRALTDGVENTRYVILGKPGQKAIIAYSLRNDGPFDVRIQGLANGHQSFDKMQWSKDSGKNASVIGGELKDARPFPVNLAPGEELTLWVTATRESCPEGGFVGMDAIPISWSALGFDHRYDYPLTAGHELPIYVCYPQRALKHISDF